jgi:hypothetical protein
MKYNRKCHWCGEEFYAKRIDQTFCTTKCRNGFHNHVHKEKRAPFKQILDGLKAQEELLDKIYKAENGDVLFDEQYLKKHGIDISLARQRYVDENNKLVRVEFLNYALLRTINKHFKLTKI